MNIRVLHVNHTALVGGAEHSLLELLSVLPTQGRALACPEGDLAARARALGVTVMEIPQTEASFRLHPVQTPAAIVSLAAAAAAVRSRARLLGADIVHANSVRAGLTAAGTRALGGPPVVTHVRDVLPSSRPARAVRAGVSAGTAHMIAISRYVAERFAPGASDDRLTVIDNPVDTRRFRPDPQARTEVRAELGIPETAETLAVLGQLTPWKAQDDAIRVLAQLRDGRPHARLLIVGGATFVSRSTRFDNRAYERRLHELVDREGLRDAVHFLGTRNDPERIMAAADVLLVPSHEEPFGRTVIEALSMRLPVLATDTGGPAEILRTPSDGFVLPPGRPHQWAQACLKLLERTPTDGQEDPRAYAERRFSPERHAAAIERVYSLVVDA